jgi:hypothetical protein
MRNPENKRRECVAILGMALGAFIVCVAVRAVLLSEDFSSSLSIHDLLSIAKKVALFSTVDAATIAVATVVTAILLFAAQSRLLRIGIWVLWVIAIYAVVVLALISVGTVPLYRWPLTLQLLRYSRFLADTTGLKYIGGLISPTLILAALVAIALPVLLGIAAARASKSIRPKPSSLLVVGAVVVVGAALYARVAIDRLANFEDGYLYRNAAIEFALSTATPPIEALARFGEPTRREQPLIGRAPLRPVTQPKNAIFFVIESLGAEYVNQYGAISGVTPNLNRLSAHSTIMTSGYAIAPSSTADILLRERRSL